MCRLYSYVDAYDIYMQIWYENLVASEKQSNNFEFMNKRLQSNGEKARQQILHKAKMDELPVKQWLKMNENRAVLFLPRSTSVSRTFQSGIERIFIASNVFNKSTVPSILKSPALSFKSIKIFDDNDIPIIFCSYSRNLHQMNWWCAINRCAILHITSVFDCIDNGFSRGNG